MKHLDKPPLLQKDTRYHFQVVTGIVPTTMTKFHFTPFGIFCVRLHSLQFKRFIQTVQHGESLMEEVKKYTREDVAKERTYVLISSDGAILEKTLYFLGLIEPSHFTVLAYANCTYQELPAKEGVFKGHIMEALAMALPMSYNTVFNIFRGRDTTSLRLTTREAKWVNVLYERFLKEQIPEYFARLLEIYREVATEEKEYVQFTLLMIILESIITDSDTAGVSYKIARTAAVLVGDTPEESMAIYEKCKKSYKVRSRLLHAGKNQIGGDTLKFLHALVCEVLITILLAGMPAYSKGDPDLFELVTRMGYGERKKLIQGKSLKSYRTLATNTNFLGLKKDVKSVNKTS